MQSGMKLVVVALLGLVAGCAAQVCQSYTIKSGDSPYSISQKFNILPDDLATALSDQGLDASTLQPGQVIYLFPYYTSCQYVTSAGNDQECQAYLVQTGDTLNGIASNFNLYVGDLIDANDNLNSNGTGLKPGTYIKLPPWKWTCAAPGNQKPCQVYTASAGDSLSSIASLFQVTVDQLLSVNKGEGLSATSVLKPNQPVKIYPYYSSCPDGGIPATPPVTKSTPCRAYIVQKGDSLAAIARLFGLATNDLIGANPELSDPSLLTPGKEVKLPPYPDSCGQSIIVSADSAPATSGSVQTSSIKAQSVPSPSPASKASPSPASKASPSPAKVAALDSPAEAPALAPSRAPATAPAAAPKAAAAQAKSPAAAPVAAASSGAAPAIVPCAAMLLALVGAAMALL